MPATRPVGWTLALGLLACHPEPGPGDTDASAVASIALSSVSRLLPGVGQTATLAAIATDADGAVLPDAALTWHTADPTVVSVDAEGLLRGEAVGSTTVWAESGDVASNPTLAWVATVPTGALVLTDDQLVSGPVFADGPLRLGGTYDVVLGGVDVPAAGTIVLAAEDSPVAGRVVTAVQSTEGVATTLELVGLPELLIDVDLELHDTLPVAPDPAEREVEFQLSGFDCKADAELPSPWPNWTLTTALADHLVFDRDLVLAQAGGVPTHALMRLHGNLRLDVSGDVAFPLTFTGKLGCDKTVSTLRFPAPGVLGVLFAVKVPLGIGFDAEGKYTATSVKYHAQGFVRADLDLGFEYTPTDGFTELTTFTPSHDLTVRWDTPSLTQGATVEASLFPYLSAKLDVGPHLGDHDVKLAELKAGVKGEYSLELPAEQVDDPASAAHYKVALHGELSAGEDYKAFLERLGITVEAVMLDPPADSVLFESPKGAMTPSTTEVVAGEPVTLTTALDPATVDSDQGYQVESVRVWRHDDTVGWEQVAEIAPASDGQTDFAWEWTPTAGDEAEPEIEFAAYVETTEMPDTLLEVEPDSRRTVTGDAEPAMYLPFDEGTGTAAVDATTHGHDATLDAEATWDDGRCGNALDIRATGATATIPDSAPVTLPQPAWTLSFWVWFDATGTPLERYLMRKADPALDRGWDVRTVGQCTDSCVLWFRADCDSPCDGASVAVPTTAMAAGEWHHVAIVHTGQSYTAYTDAVASAPLTGALPVLADTASLVLGDFTGANAPHALLDEIRIYEQALPADSVQALYTTPCPTP